MKHPLLLGRNRRESPSVGRKEIKNFIQGFLTDFTNFKILNLIDFCFLEIVEELKSEILNIIDLCFIQLLEELNKEKKVILSNFGVLKKVHKKARTIKKGSFNAVKMGHKEGLYIPEHYVLTFKESSVLKKEISQIKKDDLKLNQVVTPWPPKKCYSAKLTKRLHQVLKKEGICKNAPYAVIEMFVNSVFYVIHDALLKLQRVEIRGLGVWETKYIPPTKKNDPKTRENYYSKPRYAVKFRYSKVLFRG